MRTLQVFKVTMGQGSRKPSCSVTSGKRLLSLTASQVLPSCLLYLMEAPRCSLEGGHCRRSTLQSEQSLHLESQSKYQGWRPWWKRKERKAESRAERNGVGCRVWRDTEIPWNSQAAGSENVRSKPLKLTPQTTILAKEFTERTGIEPSIAASHDGEKDRVLPLKPVTPKRQMGKSPYLPSNQKATLTSELSFSPFPTSPIQLSLNPAFSGHLLSPENYLLSAWMYWND